MTQRSKVLLQILDVADRPMRVYRGESTPYVEWRQRLVAAIVFATCRVHEREREYQPCLPVALFAHHRAACPPQCAANVDGGARGIHAGRMYARGVLWRMVQLPHAVLIGSHIALIEFKEQQVRMPAEAGTDGRHFAPVTHCCEAAQRPSQEA